jgi:hypothetical protein
MALSKSGAMSIKICCHRGLWKTIEEQNSIMAIKKGIEHFGSVEIDIILHEEKLLVAHDTESLKLASNLNELELDDTGIYFLDIKSKNISNKIPQKYSNIKNIFFINVDKSEHKKYKERNLQVMRVYNLSGEERIQNKSENIIIDFWTNPENIEKHISSLEEHIGNILVISPEVHHLKPDIVWKALKELRLQKDRSVFICTDLIEEAKSYFS